MRQFMIYFALVVILLARSSFAGGPREIELRDGSIITGDVVSLSNGIYTIRSESLGTVKIEESKVNVIRQRSSTSSQGASGEAKSLQNKMMNDQEIMGMIQSLQNDPEFKKILEDPDVLKAVNAGDIPALMANPKFTRLLNNSTVQEIQKKVK
jgi:exopolysaccharide biosynthesis protein